MRAMKIRSQDGKYCEEKKAIVIGGGLVGSLCICVLAGRGYKVTMYEKREDIRKLKTSKGRSINLALSHRGRKALQLVGIESEILQTAIPMVGRLLHLKNGKTSSVPYDPIGKQCIYSIERNFLNQTLLNVAEKYSNVKLFFNHKLISADFKDNTVTIRRNDTNDSWNTTADIIVGADGAFSVLRSFFEKTSRFNFSQHYIDHAYMELAIPAEKGNKLEPNHLHIWPRGEFMMIALPNQDHSWTVTLFMPFKMFTSIDNNDKLRQFFKQTFSDALELIGERELEVAYFTNSPSPLVTIKCGRYDMGNKFLIIGDAAHAMVPFYGQGMNAGFEDCTLLNEILSQTQDNVVKAIKQFTERRQNDAHAICDLALYNYSEMRDLVTKPTYRIRKNVDKYLCKILPKIWVPLYNSVSFSHMGYNQCIQNREWQDKVLLWGITLTTMLILILLLIAILAI